MLASQPARSTQRQKKVHVVGYQGSHIYVIWDPEINQLRDTSNILIKEEFSPPQNKLYEATKAAETIKATKAAEPKTNKNLPMQDISDITSREELYRPAKGFAILKSTESPLPEPKLYNEAIKGPESA